MPDGGLYIIDDNLGETGLPHVGGGPRQQQGGRPMAGAWGRGGRPPAPQTEDEFPTLAAAAAAAGPPGGSSGLGAAATPSSAAPQLRKATSRCPCGRRAVHYALREGEAAPPLECDRACEAQGRRQQLAAAFDVVDPDRHVAYWDRHRAPTYSTALLQAAHDHPGTLPAPSPLS